MPLPTSLPGGRRAVVPALIAVVLVVVVGVAALASGGTSHSTVTRARLERSLPTVFANLYAEQARLLGHPGVTPATLHARAMCDRGGADHPDVGPGGDWVCLMSWHDPNVPMPPEGYGKFELNVHSNDCYTAGGPSKLTGFTTLTDTSGAEVTNPVFEFDGCFDPAGDDRPTGISFPSVTQILSTSITPDAQHRFGVQLSCGTGAGGCRGSLTVASGSGSAVRVPYTMAEETTTTLSVPGSVPAGVASVDLTLHAVVGFASSSTTSLPVS